MFQVCNKLRQKVILSGLYLCVYLAKAKHSFYEPFHIVEL